MLRASVSQAVDIRMGACPFCETSYEQTFGAVWAKPDPHPVSEGHYLIIPMRHVGDVFAMTLEEWDDAIVALHVLRDEIISSDPSVMGFNVGANCGATAGQTVFHAHVHLIPRRLGDTPCPRGGVRGVIPDRMSY
jgi:ATP adenylyltransferase